MSAGSRYRSRRGFSLLEVLTVLVVLGILGALGVYGFNSATAQSDESSSEHSVRSVVVAQQVRFQNRGSFTDDTGVLVTLEPSWTYVGSADAAGEVSVALGRYRDLDAVGVAAWSQGRCVGAVAFDPELSETVTSRWEPVAGACTGAGAFANAGSSPW